jgi:ABC-2 type transport system ATP-binding protein
MSRPDSGNSRRSNRPSTGKKRPTAAAAAKSATRTPADANAMPVDARSADSGPAPDASIDLGPAAIVTTGLRKHYGDAEALAPLDLRIEDGERVTLIGHNGSGKTTLLRMLTGMLEPSDGSATVAGHGIASVEARAAVSYLSDQPVFYDDLSVWEHLEYIARLHDTDDWEQQAVDLVELVGLTPRVDDLPMTFSRGLKQKAAIAMAFVRPFDVMLVDEPFVGLDRTGRDALLELFRLAHDDGATLVVATHELSTVRLSDRLLALSGGELTYDGSPDAADVVMLTEGVRTDE